MHTFVTGALSEGGKPGCSAAMGADTVAQPHRSKLTGFTTELWRPGFESLGPKRKDRTPAEALLPPPDFDSMVYPRGWAVGKKRKLVNVDVVESMRRIAIQEMNRKDCEIDGLNEQLEEDCKAMERLQLQLQQERAKRLDAERENAWLHDQVGMLMNMLNDNEGDNTETPQSPVK